MQVVHGHLLSSLQDSTAGTKWGAGSNLGLNPVPPPARRLEKVEARPKFKSDLIILKIREILTIKQIIKSYKYENEHRNLRK
jgi:hypothetical protein